MNDSEIFKIAKKGNGGGPSGLNTSHVSRGDASFSTQGSKRGKSSDARRGNLNNEWIPTEAIRALQQIRQEYNNHMTETCVSQILYELNSIWRAIMRKETDAIKRKFTN